MALSHSYEQYIFYAESISNIVFLHVTIGNYITYNFYLYILYFYTLMLHYLLCIYYIMITITLIPQLSF